MLSYPVYRPVVGAAALLLLPARDGEAVFDPPNLGVSGAGR